MAGAEGPEGGEGRRISGRTAGGATPPPVGSTGECQQACLCPPRRPRRAPLGGTAHPAWAGAARARSTLAKRGPTPFSARVCARKPKRIGWYGEARATPSEASTFLASTTHGVEVALERPARPAADGQTGARARSSPHLSVSTPGGRASSERSSTTPTQRLSTSGQAGGSGWRSTDRSPFEALK